VGRSEAQAPGGHGGGRADSPAIRHVDLALEPSHPISAWNSFVNSFHDALDLARETEGMGVILDAWHVWWDPRLLEDIKAGADRIYNVQLNDYARTDRPVVLTAGGPRAVPGEGMIPLKEVPLRCGQGRLGPVLRHRGDRAVHS